MSSTNELPFLIFMNGYTACLKTYTARRLSNLLRVPLVETNKLGPCTDGSGALDLEARKLRYERAVRLTYDYLHLGMSLVVDGTFGRKIWRQDLYGCCVRAGVRRVLAVRCFCTNEDVIEARIVDRQENDYRPENEAALLANYHTTRTEEEPIRGESLPWDAPLPIVEFDTERFEVEVHTASEDSLAADVRRMIWTSVHTGRLSEH